MLPHILEIRVIVGHEIAQEIRIPFEGHPNNILHHLISSIVYILDKTISNIQLYQPEKGT